MQYNIRYFSNVLNPLGPTGLVLGGAISRNKTLQLIPNVFQNKCAKKPRRNRLTKIHLEKWLLKHRQLCEMEYK